MSDAATLGESLFENPAWPGARPAVSILIPFLHDDPTRLLAFATAVFERTGMPEASARLAADTLVQADLWGHQSHGVMRLSWYVGRLQAGVCDPTAT